MKMKPFYAQFITDSCTTAVALLLSGCVSSPAIPPAIAPTPGVMMHDNMAGLSLTDAPIPTQWWSLFNDPVLSQLEEDIAGNFALQTAIGRIAESRAQLGLATADRQPQVGLNAGFTRSAISENSPLHHLGAPVAGFSTWGLGVQASWELDLWGHLQQTRNAARAQLDATQYDAEAVHVSVAGEVARNYLLLRGIQAQIDLQLDNRDIAQNLVKMADSRLRNGVATRQEAAAARGELATLNAHLIQLQHERDTQMNALALLLGKPPRALNQQLSTRGMPAMPKLLPIGISSELARNRPDILQAQAALQAAVANIGAAKADFYPRIGLGAGLGVQAFQLADLGNWASRQYSVGPTLYLPIFQGGRLQQNLALSEARQQLAAIAYQKTVLNAWHEVDNALDGYASVHAQSAQLQQAMQQSQIALDVAQRAYQEGTADFTSVLIAQRTLLASRAELIDNTTACALSVVSLYRALGGGWSPALHASTPHQGGVAS